MVRTLIHQGKARAESQSFVVEGLRLAEEAVRAEWPVRYGLTSGELNARGQTLLATLAEKQVEIDTCTPELMKSLSDTRNPQGILLVLEQQRLSMPEHLEFVLILDALQDPGNMGSLLRSALGARVGAVILAPKCVDAYSPKVLRSAMGAHFQVPLFKMSWDAIKKLITDRKLNVFASDISARTAYYEAHYHNGITLILGNEADGLGPESLTISRKGIHIPMAKGLESLNAAAAGAILLFEIARQKQKSTG